jgi:hypothetical protein
MQLVARLHKLASAEPAVLHRAPPASKPWLMSKDFLLHVITIPAASEQQLSLPYVTVANTAALGKHLAMHCCYPAVSDWVAATSQWGGTWETSAVNSQWRVRQISTDTPARGNASKAVDGNTNTTYDNNVGSCTHTFNGPRNPWWVADLGATPPANSQLVSVRITNRQDCCWGEHFQHGSHDTVLSVTRLHMQHASDFKFMQYESCLMLPNGHAQRRACTPCQEVHRRLHHTCVWGMDAHFLQHAHGDGTRLPRPDQATTNTPLLGYLPCCCPQTA